MEKAMNHNYIEIGEDYKVSTTKSMKKNPPKLSLKPIDQKFLSSGYHFLDLSSIMFL